MNDYTNPDPQQGNNDNRYYQAPQWHPPAANGTNGLAVASLVCSIIGWFIPVILGLLAIIFGHIARGQIRQRKQGGDGLAIAGLVMGYIQVPIMGLSIAAAIVLPAYQDYITRARLTEADQELTLPLAALGTNFPPHLQLKTGPTPKPPPKPKPTLSPRPRTAVTGRIFTLKTALFTPASKPIPPSPPPCAAKP